MSSGGFTRPHPIPGSVWRNVDSMLDLDPFSNMNNSGNKRKRPRSNTNNMFRLTLRSEDAVNTSYPSWTFALTIPEELEQGRWMVAADTLCVVGDDVPVGNADKILDFHVTSGLSMRDNYVATPSSESSLLLSHVRTYATSYWSRTVTTDTIGTMLTELGQLVSRRITITLRNGAGSLYPAVSTITNWRLGLVFYRMDD